MNPLQLMVSDRILFRISSDTRSTAINRLAVRIPGG